MNADVKKEQKFKSRCSEGDDWRFPAVTCGGFHFKENMYSYKYRNKADLNKDLLWLKYAIKISRGKTSCGENECSIATCDSERNTF